MYFSPFLNMTGSSVSFRLKVFIESLGLNNSQFADECSIPRPTLSQILSGRNKKISDVIIGQIHQSYPALSISWLLFGEGPMLTNGNNRECASDSSVNELSERVDNTTAFFQSDFGNSSLLSHVHGETDTFTPEETILPDYRPEDRNFSDLRALKDYERRIKELENETLSLRSSNLSLQTKIDEMSKNPRKVSHITIYYDDSTFDTLYPSTKQ